MSGTIWHLPASRLGHEVLGSRNDGRLGTTRQRLAKMLFNDAIKHRILRESSLQATSLCAHSRATSVARCSQDTASVHATQPCDALGNVNFLELRVMWYDFVVVVSVGLLPLWLCEDRWSLDITEVYRHLQDIVSYSTLRAPCPTAVTVGKNLLTYCPVDQALLFP